MIEASPNAPVVVHKFNAGSNAKALDNAMKQYKALSPATSAMFFSVDEDDGKILCMSCVPKVTSSLYPAVYYIRLSIISGGLYPVVYIW